MQEKDLINKIQILKQVKPEKKWASLAKAEILKSRPIAAKESTFSFNEFMDAIRFLMGHKFAISSMAALLLVVGIFSVAENAAPGDSLFAIKKALEDTQTVLLSRAEKSKYDLEQANARLQDLQNIAKTNQTKKLGAAINEYKASVSKVAKNLSAESNQQKLKELARGVKELADREDEVKSLGVELDDNVELDAALISTITKEVENLKSASLSEEQKEMLRQVMIDLQFKDFAGALNLISEIGN